MGAGSEKHGSRKPLVKGAKYSKKEVLELKAIFDAHDQDADGRVTVKELMASMAIYSKNISGREASVMFNCLDKNHDGTVTWPEYLDTIYPLATPKEREIMLSWGRSTDRQEKTRAWTPTPEQLEELRTMFVHYDQDRSGLIELRELMRNAERCGYDVEEMTKLFKLHDKDDSGSLDFDEFVDMLSSSYM